jgi:hypothetical protein
MSKKIQILSDEEYAIKFKHAYDKVKAMNGHILTWCDFSDKRKNCRYTCGNEYCDATNLKTRLECLLDSMRTSTCRNCCNWSKYDDICNELQDKGKFVMAMTREEYYNEFRCRSLKDRRFTVQCTCPKGGKVTNTLLNIMHIGGCTDCKASRISATIRTKYNLPIDSTITSVLQIDEIKAKREATCLTRFKSKTFFGSGAHRTVMTERYGVPHAMQNEVIRTKAQETCLINNGAPHPMQIVDVKVRQLAKRMATCLMQYKSTSFLQSDAYHAIMTEMYGAPYPFQCLQIFEKARKTGFKQKLYISPSGIQFKCQGYEPLVIQFLLTNTYIPSFLPHTFKFLDTHLIFGKKVGRIWYNFDKRRAYWPDGRVNDIENMRIEVKSLYTLVCEFDKNMAKFKATCEQGMWLILVVPVITRRVNTDPQFYVAELCMDNIDMFISAITSSLTTYDMNNIMHHMMLFK